MADIRSFIGVPLVDDVKTKLGDFQEKLKHQINQGVQWVKPNSMHITLKFLGTIANSILPNIQEIISKRTSTLAPFEVKIYQFGVFPNAANARVLWMGVEDHSANLISLNHYLEDSLADLGIPKEDKKYHSHITLGRIKKIPSKKIIASLLEEFDKILIGQVEVKAITLFESILESTGAVYKPLATLGLGSK